MPACAPAQGIPEIKRTLRGHTDSVSFVSWGPGDEQLLSCGNDYVIKLWDVETVSPTPEAPQHPRAPKHERCHRHWECFSSRVCFPKFVAKCYDVKTSSLPSVKAPSCTRSQARGAARQTSNLADPKPARQTSNLADPKPARQTSNLADPKPARQTSNLADMLTLRLDPQGELVRNFQGHTEAVTAISWMPDGRQFVSGGYGKKIFLWRTDTSEPVSTWQGVRNLALFSRSHCTPSLKDRSNLWQCQLCWVYRNVCTSGCRRGGDIDTPHARCRRGCATSRSASMASRWSQSRPTRRSRRTRCHQKLRYPGENALDIGRHWALSSLLSPLACSLTSSLEDWLSPRHCTVSLEAHIQPSPRISGPGLVTCFLAAACAKMSASRRCAWPTTGGTCSSMSRATHARRCTCGTLRSRRLCRDSGGTVRLAMSSAPASAGFATRLSSAAARIRWSTCGTCHRAPL
jgi:hypothetical protein